MLDSAPQAAARWSDGLPAPRYAPPSGLPRSRYLPLLPALFTVLAGISWAAGGIQMLTDVSWVGMLIFCTIYCIRELWVFPQRMGVGGLVLFGGLIIWFGWDYVNHWSGFSEGFQSAGINIVTSTNGSSVGAEVVAKTTYYIFLFSTCMTFGLLTRTRGTWLARLIAKTPQPANPNALFGVCVAMFLFGIMPYFLFTTEPWYEAMWKTFTLMRSGSAAWTVGRSSGAINFNWGGYVAQWLDVAVFAGLLAAFHAIFMTRNVPIRLVCGAMFLYSIGYAFGSGTRGAVVYCCLPVIAMVFVRYQGAIEGSTYGGKRAYMFAIAAVLAMFVLMQLQRNYRNTGLNNVEISFETLGDPQDNTMFSHSIFVFSTVPEFSKPFFDRDFPGEGAIVAIPQSIFFFVIGPIPRALWNDKPVTPVIAWAAFARGAHGTDLSNITNSISTGLAGNWYALCGWAGVPQGGLLWGFLLSVFERSLWYGRRKAMIILISLAFQVTMFRTYRDPDYNLFYPVILAQVALWIVSRFVQRQSLDAPDQEEMYHPQVS